MERRYDLDWLRVFAFGLLMLFHTGMMFSTWDWHVKNLETSESLDQIMRWVHQWRMPLLFFISGSAVWFAMERYSTWKFFLERQKRLLLPLVFGMLVIIPPQVYFERLYHEQQYASFWDFYPTIFTTGSYPQGNLSWHHLWYVPYIWAYSMLTLPLFACIRSATGRKLLERGLSVLQRPWRLFLIFLPSAVSDLVLRPFWPGDQMNLFADWGNFAHKLTFFGIGFLLASTLRVYDTIAAYRNKFLVAGIVGFAVLQPIWSSHWSIPGRWVWAYRLLYNFHIWMWLLTALGYGRRYLSFNHPFLRYANEAVYPFYILHQSVIVILAYHLVYLNWGMPAKFTVVASGTFLITAALYEFAIRRWNLLRVPFGMKWKTAPVSAKQAAPIPNSGASRGTEAPAGALRFAGRHLPRLCGAPRWAWFTGTLVLGGVGGLLVLPSCSQHQSTLLARRIHAPSLADNRMGISSEQHLAIYLPPSYQEHPEWRFPVVYFLPNFTTGLYRYTGGSFQGFHLREAMDRQIRTGAAPETIVVIPNTLNFLGGSWYENSPLTGRWEDYLVKDVVGYVDKHFRTRASAAGRGLAGHGMGGLGALELALKHPETFGDIYALSPAVVDANGLRDLGMPGERLVQHWNEALRDWERFGESSRRKAFRDFIQTRLNSPSRRLFWEGLCVSYAAAVAPDLALPYPHIAFPTQGGETANRELLARYEHGFGDWPAKLARYQARGCALRSVTIEYGKDDEYGWLRRGADNLAALLRSTGIANELVVHEGGHESTLGRRLEAGMIPTISKQLAGPEDGPKAGASAFTFAQH